MPLCFINTNVQFSVMLRFTLFDRKDNRHMRLEMEESDKVSTIIDVANGCWQTEHCMLCNGYSILSSEDCVGDCVAYDDTIDLIHDMDTLPSE